LTNAISQIEQAIYTTPGCPAGYTNRADINNLTIADLDFASTDTAKIGTSDRELLRLGFTVDGVKDALAAATDIQIIDKNLLVCNGGACPTTDFAATYGNIYTAGKIGIGVTNPISLLDFAGDASSSGTLSFRGTTDPKIKILNGEAFGIQTSSGGNAGLTERLTVTNGGLVGIGKTNPTVALDVTGDLNITGNTNICELQTYTAGSGTVTCTAGYYTWAGVASATGGQMLCCKVRNPI
jgi:hypothetical protein